MRSNSVPNLPSECKRFFALFQRHWAAGTGLAAYDRQAVDRDGKWTPRTFCNAMGRVNFPNTDPSTVQAWKGERRWPQKERKNAILKIFFPVIKGVIADEKIDQLRCEMDAAWEDGQKARIQWQPTSDREEPTTAKLRLLRNALARVAKDAQPQEP